MSLARATGREEKASMFHDMRESFGSLLGEVREDSCVSWLSAFPKGIGAQLRVGRLKAERVRQILLLAMTGGR